MHKGTRSAFIKIVLALLHFIGGAALILWDLSNSNQPHELTAAPFVTVLLAISATLTIRGWIDLVRSNPAALTSSLWARLLQLFLGAFLVANLLLLLAAAKTAWSVLAN